jgi:excisionase family DNA binding protein
VTLEKHYDGHEVAEFLGVDYETVLTLAQRGDIESVRVGRLRRFPESAVQAYLDRNREPVNRKVVSLRRTAPTRER